MGGGSLCNLVLVVIVHGRVPAVESSSLAKIIVHTKGGEYINSAGVIQIRILSQSHV